MPRTSRSLRLLAFALPLAALLSCKSDGSPTAPTIESTTFAPSLGVDLSASTKTSTGLYYRDLITGTGATAASGHSLSVHYTGWLANGTQFDTNVAPTTPFPLTLGIGQVIAGWDQGLVGMKVGGRRQLIIPPSLGYGSNPNGTIPANSILVFTVDLVSTQ
jgi:FKBP-type peptidyl-prolyl cis-trans isomerase FkpA